MKTKLTQYDYTRDDIKTIIRAYEDVNNTSIIEGHPTIGIDYLMITPNTYIKYELLLIAIKWYEKNKYLLYKTLGWNISIDGEVFEIEKPRYALKEPPTNPVIINISY